MRRYPRLDATQKAIVEALRAAGCDVLSLAALGAGKPDVLVHRAGRLWLGEIKKPLGPRGGGSEHGQKVNEAQVAFALRWPVHVWRTVDEALATVGKEHATGPSHADTAQELYFAQIELMGWAHSILNAESPEDGAAGLLKPGELLNTWPRKAAAALRAARAGAL